MAVSCPKCNRPNSDEAPKCIYCGESLPKDSALKRPSEKEKAPDTAESYLVIVSPVEEIKKEWVDGLGKLTGWDKYLARQRLKSSSPWIIRVFLDLASAQKFIQGMTTAGLDSYMIKQSGLLKLDDKLNSTGMRIEEDKIVFVFEAGKEFPSSYNDIFLVVRGRIKPEKETGGSGEDSGMVSLGSIFAGDRMMGDADTGDDPLARLKDQIGRIKVKRKLTTKTSSTITPEVQVMDIYTSKSYIGIRVIEDEFDFSGFGDKCTDSSILNFNNLLKHLTEKSPDAVLDDDFKKTSYTVKPSEESAPRIAGLMGMERGGQGEAARKLHSSKGVFSDYSSRMYLHYLRKSKQSSG
jgi:hypothetical protein